MNYKILVDSKSLYEFADEKTRLSVVDALILCGKITNYQFKEFLNIQSQKNIIPDTNFETERKPVQFMTVGGKFFISQTIRNIFENHKVIGEYFSAQVKNDGIALTLAPNKFGVIF